MPVYKYRTKKGIRWYIKHDYIDEFGNSQVFVKRGFESPDLAKKYEAEFTLQKNTKLKIAKFEDVVEMWLTYKEDRITERSLYTYEKMISKHITPTFRGMIMSKITIPQVEAWQQHILSLGYRNGYIHDLQSMLSGIFSFSVRKGFRESSPFDYIEFVKITNQVKHTMKYFTPEQYKRFVSVIDDPYDRALMDTLYYTGMRCGELQARTWDDLDTEECSLFIHSNYDNKLGRINPTTKTNRSRLIYLNRSLISELMQLPRNGKYIFGGDRPVDDNYITRVKNRAIDKYNREHDDQIPYIRIHDLRHSHVSLLINSGVDSYTIAERLGHSKTMVETRYAHMFPDKRKKILDVLNNL